jgi:serine/threonine protein phosphatase PrpC
MEEQMVICVPDIQKYKMEEKDNFIVMGCDGIWEIMNDVQVCQLVKKRLIGSNKWKLSQIVEEVLDASLAKNTMLGAGCDNMTCIVIN